MNTVTEDDASNGWKKKLGCMVAQVGGRRAGLGGVRAFPTDPRELTLLVQHRDLHYTAIDCTA